MRYVLKYIKSYKTLYVYIYRTASYDDLTYATVSQTLADIANLIQAVKTKLNAQGSRVILWGSGYGATLATYARLRYPHLVDATWSSSGVFDPEPTSHSKFQYEKKKKGLGILL